MLSRLLIAGTSWRTPAGRSSTPCAPSPEASAATSSGPARVRWNSTCPSAQWDSGARNATDLWRKLKGQGFRGSLRVVGEWATRQRRAEKADAGTLTRGPSARTIARLMTIGRDNLSKAE